MADLYKKISEKIVYKKYRTILSRVFQFPDGSQHEFEIMQAPNPVAIVALTPDKKVICARQFRPGPEAILLELPGGMGEKKETPEKTAARELLEETGYVGNLNFIGRSLDSAYKTVDRYCFVATECKKIAEPKNTASEITVPVLLTVSEFRKLLRSGRMTDVEVGYLGLDYLDLLH